MSEAQQPLVDIFGKQLQIRDMVVYATRKGSGTFLNKLSIDEIGPGYIKGFTQMTSTAVLAVSSTWALLQRWADANLRSQMYRVPV